MWLTYAWRDNEDLQVDFIVQELKKAGLDVRYDRVQLVPGRRLWSQIEEAIRSPDQSDAWALVVSKASLESEPCQEELAYALDRALRSRGGDYPILGIFTEPIDRELVPGVIATRLYVSIRDFNWVEQIKAGVERRAPLLASPQVPEYFVALHPKGKVLLVECRPRAGRWIRCMAAVPVAEKDLLGAVYIASAGYLPTGAMAANADGTSPDGSFHFVLNDAQATPHESMFFTLKGAPTELLFGPDGNRFVMPLGKLAEIKAYFDGLPKL